MGRTVCRCRTSREGQKLVNHVSTEQHYMKFHAIVLLTLATVGAYGQQSKLVQTGSNGKLIYATYANEGESNSINKIPDYSHAGYKGGGIALPQLPVKKTLSPQAGDNHKYIQDAIEAVEQLPLDANGIRGAILLKAGTYELNGLLTIKKNGVVLRGEGQGENGTVLKDLVPGQHSFIRIQGSGKGHGNDDTHHNITTEYLPTGATILEVDNTKGLKAGDSIILVRQPNQQWIDALNMAQFGWKPNAYKAEFERTILRISGNQITLKEPVVDPIQKQYGGGYIYKAKRSGRISNCGIENMRLESAYKTDTSEDHGWDAVALLRAENCWVKEVTAKYFGYACVSIESQSVYNTVVECAMLDPKSITTGGRKYSFVVESGSAFNFLNRCYTRGGRHDFVTGSVVPGPNVFLDCYSTDTYADIGPHHRWATGLLFDNVYGGQIRVQNRGAMGTGHGWSGAQVMFWNNYSYKSDFKVNSAPGSKNWAIGCSGQKQDGPTGYWESWGTYVSPRSLYLQQLKDRLGDKAVKNTIIKAQESGNIWELLAAWKGEGKLR